MPKKKRKLPTPAKFKVGDRIRVKHGVKDVDYPDMPLGGWAGTISEARKNGMVTIRWTKETMEAIHPVFKNRCEIDGLDSEEYVLSGDDLEPDTGGPLEIEQPTKITTKPLSPKDQDDRIRLILGLTSNDPLPSVDDDTLEAYHEFLSKTLVFPFEAKHTSETGPFSSRTMQVKVIGLGDPDDELMIDETYGILCEARHERRVVTLPLGDLEVRKSKPNRQMSRTTRIGSGIGDDEVCGGHRQKQSHSYRKDTMPLSIGLVQDRGEDSKHLLGYDSCPRLIWV